MLRHMSRVPLVPRTVQDRAAAFTSRGRLPACRAGKMPAPRVSLACLLPVLLLTGPVFAAGAAGDLKSVPRKDPVEMAFALPRGLVLTSKEMDFFATVRQRLEPPLRSALERVETSTDQAEKLKAVKQVKQIRQQIRAAIYTILQARAVEAAKAAAKREAARRCVPHQAHTIAGGELELLDHPGRERNWSGG